MFESLCKKWTGVRDDELRTALLSCAFFFLILAGYYILKPLRDEMGVAGGVDNLPWLYLANLLTMLALAPIFGAVASRLPRRVFVPAIYRLVIGTLLLFFALKRLLPSSADIALGRVFYVWVSVFNMWLVSLFWAVMADRWDLDQSKRLFGFIAVGGTLGAITGAAITSRLVSLISSTNLVLVSIVFFEVAARSAAALTRPLAATRREFRVRGTVGILEGITALFRSRYLLGIALFVMLYSLSSTFIYFAKANVVATEASTRLERTILFSNIEIVTNVVTLLMQLLVAGQLMPRIGVGKTLVILPVITGLGFFALGVYPVVAAVMIFEAVRRAVNYAIARPARETLYTIVPRNEKYKAKSFIDTFVYRGGDVLGVSGFSALTRLGASLSGVSFAAIPIAVVWGGVGLALGVTQRRRAAKQKESA